jgi:hypothetical protein
MEVQETSNAAKQAEIEQLRRVRRVTITDELNFPPARSWDF